MLYTFNPYVNAPKSLCSNFGKPYQNKIFQAPALKSWGDVRLRDSHLTTCGLPNFHIRFPPPLFHLFSFLFPSSLCTPKAYTPINCYMQNTINILCPNWSLPCKKLLSRESSKPNIRKINRSRSTLYGETDNKLQEGQAKDQRSQRELPKSTEAKELKENTVNNLWSQQQQGPPLIYIDSGHTGLFHYKFVA